MLQISDREDFSDKLAYLMTSQHALSLAGIPQSAESLQTTTNEFLNQFEVAPTPPPFEAETKPLAGYVLKDVRHDRVASIFNRTLFRTEDQAKTELDRYIQESHHHLYVIAPVYL